MVLSPKPNNCIISDWKLDIPEVQQKLLVLK